MSMPTCPSCIYAQGICEKTGVKIRYSTGCTYYNTKPMTNADRIRNMTDEELAREFTRLDMFCCPVSGANCANEPKCQDCFKRWLKQEVSK